MVLDKTIYGSLQCNANIEQILGVKSPCKERTYDNYFEALSGIDYNDNTSVNTCSYVNE